MKPISLTNLCRGPYFRVLGILPGKGIVFTRRTNGEIIKLNYAQMHQSMTHATLAPSEFWQEVVGHEKISADERVRLAETLIIGATKIGIYDSTNERGRGVVRHNDENYIHFGDRVLVDGVEKEMDDVRIGLHWLPGAPLAFSAETVGDAKAKVAQQVLRFAWGSKADGLKLLGWLVCALLGGALEWRPHAWFSGGSGMGKTWLMNNFVKPILGDWMMFVSGRVTAAGLTRFIGSTSMPVTFDESEVDGQSRRQVRGEISQLMRISSSGAGRTLKADSDATSVVTTQPRACFLLSSITQPLASQADTSRVAVIKLSNKHHAQSLWAKMEPEMVHTVRDALPGLRYDILRDADRVRALIEEARKDAQDKGCGTREADQLGALAGAAAWWGYVPYQEVIETMVAAYKQERISADADMLVNDLLAADLRRGKGEQLLVSEAISNVMGGNTSFGILLERHGIKINDDDPPALFLAAKWRAFTQLLRGTRWEGVDLRSAFLLHPLSAELKHQQRFMGTRQRGVIQLYPLTDLIEPTYGAQMGRDGAVQYENSYRPGQGEDAPQEEVEF